MPAFYMVFARKINKIPEFYMIYARKNNKMPEFYTIFAWKIFFPNFGGNCPPAPLPPVSYAYDSVIASCNVQLFSIQHLQSS